MSANRRPSVLRSVPVPTTHSARIRSTVLLAVLSPAAAGKPVKVFVLDGDENVLEQGIVRGRPAGAGGKVANKAGTLTGVVDDLNAQVRRQGAGKSKNVHAAGKLPPKVTAAIRDALDKRDNTPRPLLRVLFIGDSNRNRP